MKPYQNRKKGHMKMYQIDFNKPIHIHFMGIGGISMSGLAEILIKEGFTISGSDVHTSDIIKHLEDKGAKVYLSRLLIILQMILILLYIQLPSTSIQTKNIKKPYAVTFQL